MTLHTIPERILFIRIIKIQHPKFFFIIFTRLTLRLGHQKPNLFLRNQICFWETKLKKCFTLFLLAFFSFSQPCLFHHIFHSFDQKQAIFFNIFFRIIYGSKLYDSYKQSVAITSPHTLFLKSRFIVPWVPKHHIILNRGFLTSNLDSCPGGFYWQQLALISLMLITDTEMSFIVVISKQKQYGGMRMWRHCETKLRW